MSDKLTFKKGPRETGLYAVGHPHSDVNIKHDGKEVGYIRASSWNQKGWSIGLKVVRKPTEDDPCEWGWVFLKRRFDTEQEAREYVKANAAKFLAMNLYHSEPDAS